MSELMSYGNRVEIGRAIRLRKEADEFEQRWPKPSQTLDEPLPAFTWIQLERQLVDLAATEAQAEMARHLVSATRKLAPFKPSEMVLREILCLTWVLLDENFRAEAEEGLGEMS